MTSRALIVVVLLSLGNLIGTPTTPAEAIAFTWDPSGASPSLGGGAFTADSLTVSNNLFAVAHPSGLTQEQFIQPITAFKLGGSPVAVSGLGSSFGLYFGIDAVFSVVGGPHFDNLDVRLMADRNADNGSVTATLAGVAFANAAGVTNDVQLAHGTLLAATLALDPMTGTRTAHFLDTFVPEPGESGFFVAPTGTALALRLDLTTPADHFQAIPLSNGDTVQLINDGAGTGELAAIPEPATLALLGTTTAGLGLARWRQRRRTP